MKAFEPTADTTISFLEAYGTDEEKAPGWQVGESDLKRAQMVLWQVAPRFRNRSLMLVREEQRLGMRPPCAKVGDVVVVIYGCTVPLVLRRRTEEDGGGFLNIGDAYLTGYMDGQAIDQVERGELKAQTFKIF